MTAGHRGDHAVDQASWRHADSTTLSIDATCRVEVGDGVEAEQVTPSEQATEVGFPLVVPCSRNDFHHNELSDAERTFTADEFGDALVHVAPGATVVLHPGGGVGEDHRVSAGPVSTGMSPIAFAPCMASASSRVMGCPARWRSARSTASVLVWMP